MLKISLLIFVSKSCMEIGMFIKISIPDKNVLRGARNLILYFAQFYLVTQNLRLSGTFIQ